MGRRKKISPAKKGLIALGILCIGFMGVDIYNHGWPFNGGEQVISIVDEEGNLIEGSVPEPSETDTEGVYGSVELTGETPGMAEKNNNYSDYQMERQRTRDAEKEILQKIIDDKNTAEKERAAAQQAQMKIAERMEHEMMIEQLLEAKGFIEPIAFIQDGRMTVVITGDLTEDDARQIADIVSGVTSRKSSEVVIVKRESK